MRSTRYLASLAVAAMATTAVVSPAVAADGDLPEATAHYDMSVVDGALQDVSGNDRHAPLTNLTAANVLDVGGDAVMDFDGTGYATMPQGAVTGTDNDFAVELTVAMATQQNQFAWVIGDGVGAWNTSALGSHVFVNPKSGDNGGNKVLAGIRHQTGSNGNGEVRVPLDGSMADGTFSTITLTSADDTLTVYVNGVEVATTTHTYAMSDIVPAGDVLGYIGRSLYQGDALLKAKVADLRFFDEALTAEQVAAATPDAEERDALFAGLLHEEIARVLVGSNESLDAVTGALSVPSSVHGVALEWASSEPEIVSTTGAVTRPDVDTPVTLTATDANGGTYVFEITVKRITDEELQAKVEADLAAIALKPVANENLPLAAEGANGSTITWTSSNEDVVTVADPDYEAPAVGAADPYRGAGIVTRPEYGAQALAGAVSGSTPGYVQGASADVTVELTATAEYMGKTATATYAVTVPEKERTAPDAGYASAYFKSDGAGGERIWEAYTTENNVFTFTEANGGQPAIELTTDTKGLRDPYIFESVNGDRYYMIATDLCIGCGTGWGPAQQWGSLKVHIWESQDLVTWTRTNAPEDTGITVNQKTAGNTWAPEVYWDDSLQSYVVFWASRIYEDETHSGTPLAWNDMFYVLTRDFQTFTEPVAWQSTGNSRIDSTVMKIGEYYYRWTKNENGDGADGLERGKDIFLERSKVLTSVTTKSDWNADPETTWQLLDTAMTGPKTNQAGEGPEILKLNEGDPNNVTGDNYVFFVDNYGAGGYVPFLTTGDAITSSHQGDRLSQRADWVAGSKSGLPPSPRHGAFVNVPQGVLDALGAWDGSKATATVGSATAVTFDEATRTLTATVTADDRGDIAGRVTISAGTWSTSLKVGADGIVTLKLPAEVKGFVAAAYDGYVDGRVEASQGYVSGVPQGTVDEVDTSALEAAIEAGVVQSADSSRASVAAASTALEQAVATAEGVVEQAKAGELDQYDVNAALAAFNTAKDGALALLEPAVVSVSAAANPSEYLVGATFDDASVTVTPTYAYAKDGMPTTLATTGFTVTAPDLGSLGAATGSVLVNGDLTRADADEVSAEFTVEVVRPTLCQIPGRTVEASFAENDGTYKPLNACDGNPSTSWSTWAGTKVSPVTYTITVPEAQTVDQVRFTHTEGAIASVNVEYLKADGTWAPALAAPASAAAVRSETVIDFDPVSTTSLRLTFDTPNSYVKTAEIIVPTREPVDPPEPGKQIVRFEVAGDGGVWLGSKAFDPAGVALTVTAHYDDDSSALLVEGEDYTLSLPAITQLGEARGVLELSPDLPIAEGAEVPSSFYVSVAAELRPVVGVNRYVTSREVLADELDGLADGADVFVVSGRDANASDALVAAPVAARLGGAVVLSDNDAMEQDTIDLLVERRPASVTVVGGTLAIGEGVVEQLEAAFPELEIGRVSGKSRVETAAEVASEYFDAADTEGVLVASGVSVIDALAGSVVAGQQGWPVLYASADDHRLPEATADAIVALSPESAVVAGGKLAVHPGVDGSLRALVFDVDRLAGKSRYDTADMLAALVDQPADFQDRGVVVANGHASADVLAYAHVAASKGWPVQLAQRDCLPAPAHAALSDPAGFATRVHVGGSVVLDQDLTASLTRCE